MLVPAGCRTCEFCGFEFPANQNDNLDKQASQLAIMGKAKPIKYEPTRMRFSRHIKEDRPDSLRVDYYEGIRKVASEWVCLFHQGRPLQNARLWWGNYVGAERPDNIFEAISMAERYAMLPEYIYIQRKGKFDEVVSKGNPVKTNNEALSI
jgi:hypothetical protein